VKKQLLLALAFVLNLGLAVAQQNKTVTLTGKVLTADGQPAWGLTLSVKHTNNVAYTDRDGAFNISAPAGKTILLIKSGVSSEEQEVMIEATVNKVLTPITIKEKSYELSEVVVTGQYSPQSVRNSVYNVRTISAEKIKLRGATNVQQILNTEFGFRFNNDLTLGTADVEMMGMTGRNVKILLDGVPMLDRSDARESLNQIDVNMVERIEVVEGPISVVYGTDALAGVINIITKKPSLSRLSITAKMQEETAGNEYSALSGSGIHNKNVAVSWQNNKWSALLGFSNNEFGGWNNPPKTASRQEVEAIDNKWKPKNQYLGNLKVGYDNNKLKLWYRLDALDEDIDTRYGLNLNNYIGVLQTYTTKRYTNQLHSDFIFSNKLNLTAVAGYTDLQRKTTTIAHNYADNTQQLTTGAGEQDLAKFNTFFFRSTAQYMPSKRLSIQPGLEFSREAGSGARIKGSPVINDYAFFISAEFKPTAGINIRPGVRLIKNSVYNAQAAVPSLNTKLSLSKNFDLRLAYARGFRAPALRELYFDFVDASHTIYGNTNLRAESSDSFNGSVSWAGLKRDNFRFQSMLAGFYNLFHDRIDYGVDANDPTATTLINISSYKTTGVSIDNTLNIKNLQLNFGASYIGRFNRLSENNEIEVPQFSWTAEFFSTVMYHIPKFDGAISVFFKHTGKRPSYQLVDGNIATARLAQIGGFSWTDLMLNKNIYKRFTLNAGVKNVFNVTQLNNTGVASGGAHSAGGGSVPYSYGRSYVLGLSFNWNK
jgi:outer membrane receptor for ferrienterochelin and colicins